MLILVKIIGILSVALGAVILLNPKAMKQLIIFWNQGNRLYVAAILRILVGVIFLLAASQCRVRILIIVLGIVVIVKGIFIFILGLERVKSMLGWWQQRSFAIFRLLGLLALVLGAIILYSA
ncbi:MAG: hypothetical protein NC936_05760 [Candidatus Omnitrophica bacterium]|nr:hypothetical protein [Candidatus Omnitrophota bacterium]